MTQAAYDLYEELESLNTLVEAYHGWFFDTLNRALYPAEYAGTQAAPIPSLFVETLAAMSGADTQKQEADRFRELEAVHRQLEEMGKTLSGAENGTGLPGYRDFDKFTALFKLFINGIQKTCQYLILEEWGLDALTGLKNGQAMEKELAQEMERVARQGRSFSLALARIDNFDQIEALGRKEADQHIRQVALFIGRSLRSFDSAYRLDRRHFVMALKQADIVGGKRALARLSDQLERAEIYYDNEGRKQLLTMSCCVVEPMPEDRTRALLEEMSRDLDTQRKDKGVVLTYHEISPLQRYVQSGRGKE